MIKAGLIFSIISFLLLGCQSAPPSANTDESIDASATLNYPSPQSSPGINTKSFPENSIKKGPLSVSVGDLIDHWSEEGNAFVKYGFSEDLSDLWAIRHPTAKYSKGVENLTGRIKSHKFFKDCKVVRKDLNNLMFTSEDGIKTIYDLYHFLEPCSQS